MRDLLPYVTFGAQTLPGILTFRLLPIVGYAALVGGDSWLVRSSFLALYAPVALLAAQHGATPFYWLVLAYLYFTVAGWLTYELVPLRFSKSAWLATVAFLFWILPAIVVKPIPRPFLVLAWDFTLAAYSYGVETRIGPTPRLRDFLFFLLVNPSLVYRHRGHRIGVPAVDARGAARAFLGVLAVFLSISVLDPARAHAASRLAAGAHGAAGAAGVLALGALRLCREYAVQSGVASLQIGCMRQLGYLLPERFSYPLLSRSPADFWRRWNTYVGGWARIYVFLPLVSAMPRRLKQGRSAVRAAYAIAVLLTFAIVGALHDAFRIAVERRWTVLATLWFVAMGCCVVAWEAIGKNGPRNDRKRYGRTFFGRGLFLISACYAASSWP